MRLFWDLIDKKRRIDLWRQLDLTMRLLIMMTDRFFTQEQKRTHWDNIGLELRREMWEEDLKELAGTNMNVASPHQQQLAKMRADTKLEPLKVFYEGSMRAQIHAMRRDLLS